MSNNFTKNQQSGLANICEGICIASLIGLATGVNGNWDIKVFDYFNLFIIIFSAIYCSLKLRK